jgi:hypothetical protein
MNFLQKNPLFLKLQDPTALEADGMLLQKKNPKARALSLKSFDKAKLQKEILYELLDYASEEEIVNNRTGKQSKAAEIKVKEINTESAPVKQTPAPVKKKPGNKKGHKRR